MTNRNTRLIIYIFLFLSSLFLVIDIITKKGIFTAHDVENSIYYFGSFYDNISEGNLVPRWGGNIANLYGSPTLMFFYPLSFYMMVPFRLVGLSLIDCMKLIFFISFILSGVFSYLWLRKHFSHLASLAGSLLYLYAPYRINDIYARGSLAENTSFLLLPVVLLSLWLVRRKPSGLNIIILALILSCLVLAHPYMVIVFAPLLFAYLIVLKFNKKFLLACLIGVFLCIGISAFYTMPLMIENKYTHFDMSRFRGEEYFREFIDFSKMVKPQWRFIDSTGKLEYQTYQIGLIQIAVVLIASFFLVGGLILRKISGDHKRLLILGLFCFIFSIFIMHKISDPFYKYLFFLRRIQFPWRFLGLNLFAVSIITALLIDYVKSKKIKIILLIILFISGIILYQPYARGHGYKDIPDNYYLTQIKENTDAFSTLPIWAAQPDSYPRDDNRYKIIEGKAQVEILKRTSTYHSYFIRVEEPIYMADQTFYFPGWKVLANNNKLNIEFQDQAYRGLIAFRLPKGEYLVEVIFGYSKIRLIADIISIITLISIFIYVGLIQKRLNNHTGL